MNKKGNDLVIPIIAFIILILIFAIFIILSFTKNPEKQCIFPAEVDCVGYQAQNSTSETLSLQLKNNLHEDLNVTKIEVLQSKCSYSLISTANGSSMWLSDDILWIKMDCKELNTEQGFALISIELKSEYTPIPLRYSGKVKYYK